MTYANDSKNILLPILSIIIVLFSICSPSSSIKAALHGINLCVNIVFPSIFPFLVCSEILIETGFMKWLGYCLDSIMRPLFNVPGCSYIAFLMGMTSGFPVGAKVTSDLRTKGWITKTEGERLIAFTNNSGPMFIIGSVATGMLNTPSVGKWLLICHWLACITVGLLFRFYKYKETYPSTIAANTLSSSKPRYINKIPSGQLLTQAVKNSSMAMLSIGGLILIFSLIINMLSQLEIIDKLSYYIQILLAPMATLKHQTINSLLSGIIEITNGIYAVSGLSPLCTNHKLIIISTILGWSGISVHCQVLSILSSTDISIKPYILGKTLQAMFATLYMYIATSIII